MEEWKEFAGHGTGYQMPPVSTEMGTMYCAFGVTNHGSWARQAIGRPGRLIRVCGLLLALACPAADGVETNRSRFLETSRARRLELPHEPGFSLYVGSNFMDSMDGSQTVTVPFEFTVKHPDETWSGYLIVDAYQRTTDDSTSVSGIGNSGLKILRHFALRRCDSDWLEVSGGANLPTGASRLGGSATDLYVRGSRSIPNKNCSAATELEVVATRVGGDMGDSGRRMEYQGLVGYNWGVGKFAFTGAVDAEFREGSSVQATAAWTVQARIDPSISLLVERGLSSYNRGTVAEIGVYWEW